MLFCMKLFVYFVTVFSTKHLCYHMYSMCVKAAKSISSLRSELLDRRNALARQTDAFSRVRESIFASFFILCFCTTLLPKKNFAMHLINNLKLGVALFKFSTVWYQTCHILYLNEISGKQLQLPRRNAVIQNLPSFPQAKLHHIMLDRCSVIGRWDPGQQDSLLRAIGCEAPWWGKQHQWFRSTCRKYYKSTSGLRK